MRIYRLLKVTRFKESGKYYDEEKFNWACPVLTHENKAAIAISVYMPDLCDELRKEHLEWLEQGGFVLVEGEDCVPHILRDRK